MNSQYIPRPLADKILNTPAKVLVIEGARAVGKTKMARSQLVNEGFSYYSLGDPSVLSFARQDPFGWFNSIATPAIIDEAQMLDSLPLMIKEKVDAEGEVASQKYILTGSSSIGKATLNGQDPLTRRARRFTLSPLTLREQRHNSYSVVDDLWYGKINENYRSNTSRQELLSLIRTGGFPDYVLQANLMNKNELDLSIRNDISSVLGEALVPGERVDVTIADSILRYILLHPGEILNISKIGKLLGRNDRTVNSYISILMKRFLVYPLKNLRISAAKQAFTRSKMHPIDTSFSAFAFRDSGVNIEDDHSAFGHIFESFVVNQIRPSIGWSMVQPYEFFWREPTNSPKEVDYVLKHNDEIVGLEVKSSSTVGPDDFNGLKALQKREGLHRGYIVYMGNSVVKNDGMWAIPVSALWEKEAFAHQDKFKTSKEHASIYGVVRLPQIINTRKETGAMAPGANIFISYNHNDNNHLDGQILHFIQAVCEEYEFEYAQTLNPFIDRDSINWGEDWRQALDLAIDATNFIIPAVTPRYLASGSCQSELFSFAAKTQDQRNSHILSLVWNPFEDIELSPDGVKARKIIKDHQYIDVSSLRDVDASSREYKEKVQEVVRKLRNAIEGDLDASVTMAEGAGSALDDSDGDEEGLFEQMEEVNIAISSMEADLSAAGIAIDGLVDTINSNPMPNGENPSMFAVWARQINKATADDVKELNHRIDSISSSWDKATGMFENYILIARAMPYDEKRQALDSVRDSLVKLKAKMTFADSFEVLYTQIRLLQQLSPKLKPVSQVFLRTMNMLERIRSSVDELIDQTNL